MYKRNIWGATEWRIARIVHLQLPLFMLMCLSVGSVFGIVGPIGVIVMVSACAGALLIIFRQDELAGVLLLATHLYLDWYMAYDVLCILLVIVLLGMFYLLRSREHPWVAPRMLWLWAIFLTLALFPALRGALTQRDLLIYYPNVVLGALLFFCVGTLIARSTYSLLRFFKLLALFGCLVALHTIIQARFHVTLLGLSRVDTYINGQGNYQLSSDASILRVGSFFIDPNWDGTFLAMLFFISLGLFICSTTLVKKLLYGVEMGCILLGLLFTFSAGASLSLGVGFFAFVALGSSTRIRMQMICVALLILGIGFLGFSQQIFLLLQHGSDPAELLLRNGVWQTAIRVIQAHPWTGVGLGHTAYLQYAEPFRVPEQFIPLDHPHNSYLEWGAMAGLPVLLVFLGLLIFLLWYALRNWFLAEQRAKTLIGAGVAAIVVLSFNSWSIDAWTLMPLAAVGWCILGAVSSRSLLYAKL